MTKRGDAVALTGSAARGNATADSDLDLWIIGARSGRFSKRFEGVNVTLLCQRPAEAVTFDNLCFYEVDDLLILRDDAGLFRGLRQVWRSHRRGIRAEIVRSTRAQLQWELQRAEVGSARHRAIFLRFAAWRGACLRVFLSRGWRVPRLHALRAELSAPLRKQLDAALGLPGPAGCRRAVKLMPRALTEVRALAGDDGYALPESIADKLARAPEEAAFVARKELVFELLPRVFGVYGIGDVRGAELLEGVAPSLHAAFELLVPRADARLVKRLRELQASLTPGKSP